MHLKCAKLTIATLVVSLYSSGAMALDALAVSAAAINTPPNATANALEGRPTELALPLGSTPESESAPSTISEIETPSASTAAPEPAAIISIEPAPPNAPPLLKAADSQGNPQHDLWARIRAGFALSDLGTDLVQENENLYLKRPDYFERMVGRSKRYLFYIVEAVEKRGMPTEVALLPMVESAFNPKAYSRAHASGLWQFIPSTGRSYGLQQTWWVDNRRDVVAATHAALDYLQKLHGMFGSWELALAAYNWGEGSVMRAIAKNQAKGLPTDYLSLRMPKETQQYVPRLIAIKNLIQRSQDFGIDLGVVPNTPYFAQITLTQHIDVALAAKLADTTLDEFTSLNPNYTRPVIQAHQPATLLLPVDKAEIFAANLESYGKPLVSWQPYPAKRGEKLDAIAHRHGISSGQLKEINGIAKLKRGRLIGNQVLLVPGTGRAKLENAAFSETVAEASHAEIYTVRKGDTLFSIARRHGVKTEQIKTWNRLGAKRLVLNQKLRLGPPEKTAAKPIQQVANTSVTQNKPRDTRPHKPPPKKKRYTVRRGDTLFSIAQRFDVDLDDLMRWNKLSARARLQPGDKVTILLTNNS